MPLFFVRGLLAHAVPDSAPVCTLRFITTSVNSFYALSSVLLFKLVQRQCAMSFRTSSCSDHMPYLHFLSEDSFIRWQFRTGWVQACLCCAVCIPGVYHRKLKQSDKIGFGKRPTIYSASPASMGRAVPDSKTYGSLPRRNGWTGTIFQIISDHG